MPSYLNVGLNLPDFAVECAFASVPTSSSQTWTDITPYVRQVGIRRGRNDTLSRIEAGTLDLLLDNRDARFNPGNTAGPYYGNLVPRRQIRVLAQSGATTTSLFTGFCGGWPQEWPDPGFNATVHLTGVDFLGLLPRLGVPGSIVLTGQWIGSGVLPAGATTVTVQALPASWPTTTPYTVTIDAEDMTVTGVVDNGGGEFDLTITRGANGTTAVSHYYSLFIGYGTITNIFGQLNSQTTGARIQAVLNIGMWQNSAAPAGWYTNVATGLTTMTAATADENSTIGGLVQEAVDTEAGLLWAGTDGLPVFHDRHYRITNSTSTATFGDAGGSELPYTDLASTQDEDLLYNTIVAQLANSQKVIASDVTSALKYWPQTLSVATGTDAGVAQDYCDYLLSRYKDPQLRLPSIQLDGHLVTNTTLISLEIDQRYTVKRRPAQGTALTQDVYVEGVSHTLGRGEWVTTLNLGSADVDSTYWKLGTSTLDTTTRLAF